jgi:hypothetical protein
MPTKHSADRGELGRRGEALACARLTAAGLRIVARNWRCQTGEIDEWPDRRITVSLPPADLPKQGSVVPAWPWPTASATPPCWLAR